MTKTKRTYRYSPAALVLMGAGVSITELAVKLDLSPTAITRKLKGELGGVAGNLGDAIVELAGSEVYDQIFALVYPDGEPLPEVPA
jgi:hypothetical protein